MRRGDKDGFLELSFYKEGESLVCAIKDNGLGVQKSQAGRIGGILLHKSRGKDLVERRVKILNQGNYNILISPPLNSTSGGTEVVIKFGYK